MLLCLYFSLGCLLCADERDRAVVVIQEGAAVWSGKRLNPYHKPMLNG